MFQQRKKYLREIQSGEVKNMSNAFTKVNTKGVRFGDEENDRKGKTSAPMNAEERKAETEKKKKEILQQNKAKKKKAESLESRMGAVVKLPKDKGAKQGNDRQSKFREEMGKYIKDVILEDIINSALCYGESLLVGRDIQRNFENRPVTKFVYPMI
jgi:hypothetical protein